MVNSISWTPKDDALRVLILKARDESDDNFSTWAKKAFKHYIECEENSQILSNIDDAEKTFGMIDSFRYTEKVKCIVDERSGHYRIPRNNPCANINCQYDACESYKFKLKIKFITQSIDWTGKKPDARFITRLWQDVALKYEEWSLSYEVRDLFKNHVLHYKENRGAKEDYFIIWLRSYITDAGYTQPTL